jgi:ribonuclease HI
MTNGTHWQINDNALYNSFNFDDLEKAFTFIRKIMELAKADDVYPKWTNIGNRVEVWLPTSTQSTESLSDRDRQLTDSIDDFYTTLSTILKPRGSSLKKIKIYTDGGSRGNPGPSASGFVLLDMDDNIVVQQGIYLGITTNNQAEYQALKLALEEAKKLQARQIDVYMDSLLVVNQMLGKFKIKNRDLWPIYDSIKKLTTSFNSVTFTHVPRELNKLADRMVNKALDEHLRNY